MIFALFSALLVFAATAAAAETLTGESTAPFIQGEPDPDGTIVKGAARFDPTFLTHSMRSVAEQRYPVKTPARQRILIDHREFQHAVGGADKGRHIEPVEMPVGERADEIVDRAGPVPVALAINRGFDFGHPVDQLQAVITGSTDRIDHHLAMRQPSRPHHAGAGQNRFPSRHPAPHVDAGIARLAFAGEKLLAHRRIDAVAGDRDAAAHVGAGSASGPVGKMHAHAGLVLLDAGAVMAGMEPVAPDAGNERTEQDHLQIAAMDRELRMIVARRASQRLLINQLAKSVEKGRVFGRDCSLRQHLLQSKRSELLGRMRQQVDADTDWFDFGG